MALIEIKTKKGTTILIKGTETEVSRIAFFIRELIVGEKKEFVVKDKKKQEMRKKRSTTSELITELKEERYFDKPRSLGEILNTLQEKGYVFKITSLSGTMLDFVKRRILARKKIDKKWKYGK